MWCLISGYAICVKNQASLKTPMHAKLSKKIVLFTVILIEFLVGMEFDLFVPSFPELQQEFALTPFWVEASLSSNLLAYCLSLFCVGLLGDIYGRKPIIIAGLSLFIIGCILCLKAPFYGIFLFGRALQGFGIAAPAIMGFLIIADTYPIKKQQKYIALLNGLKNAAVAGAPVVGSYITLFFHWQGNFIALFLFGMIALIMAILFIPTYKLPEHPEGVSMKGYGLLFTSKPLLLLMVHITFLFVPYWIFVGISPILYMKDLGVNLKVFGFYQGILALVFALGSFCYGLLINKFNQKKLLYLSNGLFIASFVMMIYFAIVGTSSPVVVTFILLLFTLGQIVPTAIIFPICLNYLPHAKSRVSGLVGASCLILQSIGLQTAGWLYDGNFTNIAWILAFFLLLIIVTLFALLRNHEIMHFSQQ